MAATKPSFFSSHPSAAVAIGGLVVIWLGTALHSAITVLGLVGLLLGAVGLIGTRKAQAVENLRRADMASIDAMSGPQFEEFLVALFASKGCRVWHSGGRGDFGADLIVDGPRSRTVVQAKRWNALVGHGAVQEVVAARGHYQGQYAIVVTNSHFTDHAKKLARTNQVELWDRERVAYEITQTAALPPTSAARRFSDELARGAPVAFQALLVLVASASSSGHNKKRRRR